MSKKKTQAKKLIKAIDNVKDKEFLRDFLMFELFYQFGSNYDPGGSVRAVLELAAELAPEMGVNLVLDRKQPTVH